MKKIFLFLSGLIAVLATQSALFCAQQPERPVEINSQGHKDARKTAIDLLDSLTKNKDIAKFIRSELEALATATGSKGEIRLQPENSPLLSSIIDTIARDVSQVLNISTPKAVYIGTNSNDHLYYSAEACETTQEIWVGLGTLEAYLLPKKEHRPRAFFALCHTLAHEMGHLCDHEQPHREKICQRQTLALTMIFAICIFIGTTSILYPSFSTYAEMSPIIGSMLYLGILIFCVKAFHKVYGNVAVSNLSQNDEFLADKRAIEFLHKRGLTSKDLKNTIRLSLADINPKKQRGVHSNEQAQAVETVPFTEKINSIIDKQLGLSTHPSDEQRIAFVDQVLAPAIEQPDELRLALQRLVDWLLRS